MEVSPVTKLNKQSTVDYKSLGSSYQLADNSSRNDLTCDLTRSHGEECTLQMQISDTN